MVEESQREWIKKLVTDCCGLGAKSILQPTNQMCIAGNIYPESGFFVMLDFLNAKGMKYQEVNNRPEQDVLYFYYIYANVKLLMGKSIGRLNKDEFVARVSFAMEEDIVNMFKQMKAATSKLHAGEGEYNA